MDKTRTDTHMKTHTDRQTYGQTHITHMHTNRQTHIWKDIPTEVQFSQSWE